MNVKLEPREVFKWRQANPPQRPQATMRDHPNPLVEFAAIKEVGLWCAAQQSNVFTGIGCEGAVSIARVRRSTSSLKPQLHEIPKVFARQM